VSLSDWIDVTWSLILEEGRGGFMDSGRYREVMTGLFFHGEVPPEQSEDGKPGKRAPSVPARSKLDALRELDAEIAARKRSGE
jgi:hypothetical protein